MAVVKKKTWKRKGQDVIYVWVDSETKQRLKKLRTERGMVNAKIVRDALQEYFTKHNI